MPSHPQRCCRTHRAACASSEAKNQTAHSSSERPETYPTASVCSGWTANSPAPTNAATPLQRHRPAVPEQPLQQDAEKHRRHHMQRDAGHMESERVQAPDEAVERIRKVYERAERGVDDQEPDVGQIGKRPVREHRVVIVVDERIVERVGVNDSREHANEQDWPAGRRRSAWRRGGRSFQRCPAHRQRVRRPCQRSQPGGTPAWRASSSMAASSFLAWSISAVTRESSAIAFWRSSATLARWNGSSRLTKSADSALMRLWSASANASAAALGFVRLDNAPAPPRLVLFVLGLRLGSLRFRFGRRGRRQCTRSRRWCRLWRRRQVLVRKDLARRRDRLAPLLLLLRQIAERLRMQRQRRRREQDRRDGCRYQPRPRKGQEVAHQNSGMDIVQFNRPARWGTVCHHRSCDGAPSLVAHPPAPAFRPDAVPAAVRFARGPFPHPRPTATGADTLRRPLPLPAPASAARN